LNWSDIAGVEEGMRGSEGRGGHLGCFLSIETYFISPEYCVLGGIWWTEHSKQSRHWFPSKDAEFSYQFGVAASRTTRWRPVASAQKAGHVKQFREKRAGPRPVYCRER